jgi:RNA polymerase sigma-70 factor, ECF subfamily
VRVRPLTRDPEPPNAVVPSFPRLFEEQAGYVWTTLRRLGVRHRDLEDLTHDVFVQVFRQLEQYDSSRPMKPWLFGFAFRIASKHRSRHANRFEVPEQGEAVDAQPNPAEQLLANERRELAWSALDELELNRRAVFILHELDGCPIPEVAEQLGMPLATAYSRLRLAREDFAQAARRLRSRQR